MVEISEMERARRKATRDADNKIPAQSFRLGASHMEKLRKISGRRDLPQVELLRELLDKEYSRLYK